MTRECRYSPLPRFGKAHASSRAVEQPRAELLLEALDLVADGTPGHAEPPARAGETLLLGDLHESAQRLQHVHCPIRQDNLSDCPTLARRAFHATLQATVLAKGASMKNLNGKIALVTAAVAASAAPLPGAWHRMVPMWR